ncbi:MAG: DMT family transporter [Candidatus Omnitrophica bacterium]|nr:DMT family transporter [Candidatus Omnitrophota bacterium]
MSLPARKKAFAYMFAGSLSFALMGALARVATQRLPFLEVVFFRSLIGLLMIVPVIHYKGQSFRGRHPVFLTLRSFAGFAALCLYFLALSGLPLGLAVMLNYTSPIFTVILAAIFLKERLTLPVGAAVLAAFAGIGLLLKPGGDWAGWLPWVAVASGLLAAVAYVTIRYLGRFESPGTIIFYFCLFATLASLPMMLVAGFVLPDTGQCLLLLGIGVVGTVGQMGMTTAYAYADAGRVSTWSYITPLTAFLIGAGVWREIPDLWSALGSLLIIGSAVYLLRRD